MGRKRSLLLLVALFAIVAPGADAGSPGGDPPDHLIEMSGNRFVPSSLTVDVDDDTYAWHNDDAIEHDLTAASFDPPQTVMVLEPDQQTPNLFAGSVGKTTVVCSEHARKMRMTVDARPRTDDATQAPGEDFTVTIAILAALDNANIDLQIKKPGSDRYVRLADDLEATTTYVFAAPQKAGKYKVRGRTQFESDEVTGSTKYSSPLTLTVAPV